MKNSRLLILIAALLMNLHAETYKKVQIYFSSRTELMEILRSDLAIDHAEISPDNSIIVFLSSAEYLRLQQLGHRHKVLIEDWDSYYKNRKKLTPVEKQVQLEKTERKYGVTGFKFGSMGGFYTFAEIVAELDSMRSNYPDLISEKFTIGQSHEGRELWMVKISDNPDHQDEDEPQVCFDALLHAREGASMATIMYFMYYLLENYGTDSVVTYLVDNREIYFAPCLNPDGYEYNREKKPNGGGMWRKNRRNNGDGSYGVDLNRNFAYAWGYDDNGSSPNPTSNVYRGPSALSEPETKIFADFVKTKEIKTHINYHSYSNLILYPWGYTGKQSPDSIIYREYADDMSKYNGYRYGNSINAIGYLSNGTERDWMYGEQTENKNKIFSFVFEVGSAADGFWPDENRIIPLAEENIGANLYLCWIPQGLAAIAGHNFQQSVFLPGDSVNLQIVVKNRGLESIDDIQVKLTPLSQYLDIAEPAQNVAPLNVWQSDSIDYQLYIHSDAPAGEYLRLVAQTRYQNLLIDTDTIGFFIGSQFAVFADSGDSLSRNWTTINSAWKTTTNSYHSFNSCYTDSSTGTYAANANVVMTLTNPIDLSGYPNPRLTFWTSYEIESNWDCGLVQVSTDNGSTWSSLKGQYTTPGSGNGAQPKNVPVYHGFQTNWIQEDIDLSAYQDRQILLRFFLKSDNYIEYDGWYIDDISIYYYSVSGIESQSLTDFTFKLRQNYPNPFNPESRIEYVLPEAGLVRLSIYNILGEKVAELVNDYQPAGNHFVNVNIQSIQPVLCSGIYFYTLQSGNYSLTRKMMILK
ncbi:MAG: immune inhibitor A [Candidatus Marinimicrobia bacterium]|nr:immune inhibitor A [Candidatus Neomarinimicrobiota bacterium]